MKVSLFFIVEQVIFNYLSYTRKVSEVGKSSLDLKIVYILTNKIDEVKNKSSKFQATKITQ